MKRLTAIILIILSVLLLCACKGDKCADGHQYVDGVCTVCQKQCQHTFDKGVCAICGFVCNHDYVGGVCAVCGMKDLKDNKVRFSAIPDEVQSYDGCQVYLGDARLPLYSVMVNVSQVWTASNYQRTPCGVGYFELDGSVTVTVKVPYQIDYASKVRPLSAKIIPVANVEQNTLTFTVKSAGYYSVEIKGDKTKAIHLFVSDYEQDKQSNMEALAQAEHFIYFGAGIHTAASSQYINEANEVVLDSNTVVYIDDGAVVRARLYANGKSNITVCGRGIIDGSTFERNATTNTRLIPIDFNFCTDITLKQFSLLDPAGWTVNFYFNVDCLIDGIKIISSRSNGDGISLQSCKDITVTDCFVRTWDDSLVVKNYPKYSDKRVEGVTERITFTDCVLWTDLAQCMEIGYETVGQTFRDVTFDNITVLHALHKPVISIHNANNADIKNIEFSNITVEDFSAGGGDAGGNCELIDIRVLFSANWSTNHKTTALGSIDGVTVENVSVLSGRNAKITIGGCVDARSAYSSKESFVSNVTITDITVKGVNIGQDSPELTLSVNRYVRGYTIESFGAATGAKFRFSQTQDALNEYGDALTVTVINGK